MPTNLILVKFFYSYCFVHSQFKDQFSFNMAVCPTLTDLPQITTRFHKFLISR